MKSQHLVFALLCAQLLACQAIAGIKDRHVADGGAEGDDDAGAPRPSSKQCASYCEVVMDTCQDPQQVYPTDQVCRNVCMKLPAGDDEATGNTVACRNKIAVAANSAKEGLEESCPVAGPGGAGTCGDDCESYCYLYKQVCPADALDDCEAKCKGLPTKKTLDAVTADHDGDTLQCRLVHVSNAVGDGATHCKHARIVHPEGYCSDKPDADLSCKNYCRLVNTECSGDNAVYQSDDQCEAVCEALGPGKVGDQSVDPTTDTMACRLWHAYTAVLDPATHCAHAGPGGDGHCGDGSDTPTCAPYCKLLQKGCASEFKSEFGDDIDKCREACAKVDGSEPFSGYSVKKATDEASALQCRLLFATRAVDGDADACADAFGNGKSCHD